MTKLKRVEDGIQRITILSIGVIILLVLIYLKKLTDISISNPSLSVVVSNPDPIEVTGSVTIANPDPIEVTTDLSKYQDAFARLRISDPYTLGDYKHVYSNDPSYIDILTGGAAITYIPNNACVELSTVAVGASSVKHQTKIYHHYQPGKSQYILSTFVFGTANPGCTKRTGYFDDRNGIFLEQSSEGVLSWNVRSYVTGVPNLVDSEIQANWNRDPCNGSGSSGFNLDVTKTQLIFIDFQWLGVGRVRCGFIHDGEPIVAHEFYHSNVLPVVYLSNPSLPVRCELSSTGGVGTMRQICATVISEGGYSETGHDFSIDTGNVGRDCDVGGTKYPIIAIRLKNHFKGQMNRMSVRITNFSLYTENHGVLWQLWKLPTAASLTGLVTWNDANPTSSGVEYSVFPGGIDVTGCTLLISGFNAAGNANAGNNAVGISDPSKARMNLLTQNFDSTNSEVFVLVAVPVGTNINLNSNNFGSIQWREIY